MKGKSVAIFLSSITLLCLWGIPVFAVSDSLMISKVFYGNINNQWIELYNASDDDINLKDVTVVIQAAAGMTWDEGASAPQIQISANVDAANSVIKAHGSFLISNAATISITMADNSVEYTTPNYQYTEKPYLTNFPFGNYPVRGFQLSMNGELVDSVMFGLPYEEGEESNPQSEGLFVDEFYDGPEPDNEAPILTGLYDDDGSLTSAAGLVRVTDANGDTVDTDENNSATANGSDWIVVPLTQMDPTPGEEVTVIISPTGVVNSFDVGNTSCLVSWECEDFDTYRIYWKSVGDTEWNQLDGMALINVTIVSGLITFEDFNTDPDMPTGDFSTVSNRLYKLVLVKN